MAGEVTVSAPSHVHVGNVDINGGMGRLYGTLGFALEEPRLEVRVRVSSETRVVGGTSSTEAFARLFSEMFGLGLEVVVENAIPRHVGLGATTAEALSIGYAASILAGRRVSVEELALAAGRGRVSALGVYSFKYGGFIVDGGFVPGKGRVPPLVFRAHVPASIAVVVGLPDTPRLEEILELKEREDEILESMPRMDRATAMENAWRVLMGIIPFVAEGDWRTAARRLYELNSGLGDYWSSRQPGRYCCREAEEAVSALLEAGALCACQSSWGPTVYGLVESGKAQSVLEAVKARVPGRYWVTRVDNEGARARVIG